MAGYTRNDTADNIADGKVINASDLDGEFNAVEAAFNASTGHTHDGTTGGGALISYADLTNTPDFDNIDINGGTIDGTAIGGTTPAAGAFTTLSASSSVTLSGGTANGVPYLNGSKVLTSGSALTFDGNTFAATAKLNITAPSNQRYSDFNTTSAGYGFSSFSYNGTAYGYIAQASATFISGSNTDLSVSAVNNLVFGANNAEAMRLTSTGLGIGTSSPASKLDVAGTITADGLTVDGDIQQENATYLIGKTSAGTTTRLFGVNSGNVLYMGGIDTSLSGGLIYANGGATHFSISGSGAASFTGNVTLGNDSTDTVTVNGYMGVGGAGVSTAGVLISNGALTSANQKAVYATATASSAASGSFNSFAAAPATAAASFTCNIVAGFVALDATKGAGSTITSQHGVYIADQTQGTNNYGITSLVSSGTNKWNIYASGTAANYFAGSVGIGTSSPAGKLSVNVDASTELITFRSSGGRQIWAHEPSANARPLTIKAQTLTYADDTATRLTVDSSGNLGLGVTPSAWGTSVVKAIQVGNGAAFGGNTGAGSPDAYMMSNAYYDGTGWKYITNDPAMTFDLQANLSKMVWNIAPSGTAGNAITFTQAMTLHASGGLSLGNTSDPGAGTLNVNGITVGRGAGAVSTNTAVGASALAAHSGGAFNVAVGANAALNATTIANATVVGMNAIGTGIATGTYITAVGTSALQKLTSGSYVTGVGVLALKENTTGSYNTALGVEALQANTTASNNTAVGYQAGYSNTTGTRNTAIGMQSMYSNTTLNDNTAVGYQSQYAITGGQNTTLGTYALYAGTETNTVAIGYLAMGDSGKAGGSSVAVGMQALQKSTSGSSNVAVGCLAMQNNTTASNNTAVGYQAGYSNTTGAGLTAIGYQALKANTTTGYSTAIGYNALTANTTGNGEAVGVNALSSNTTGTANVAFGANALVNNTTGTNSTAVGNGALYSNNESFNVAIGDGAAYSNTSGGVTAIGSNVLYANTTGEANVAVGGRVNSVALAALVANTTGSYNTALGAGALSANTTASNNTALGFGALAANTTASSNTAVGYQAGYSNTTGVQNVSLGSQSLYSVNTANNNTAVGTNAGFATTTGGANVFMGINAGYYNTTGAGNTFVGSNPASGVGYYMTTGSKNTILGGYNGNQGGLDIRTLSNYLVLSDGDGNPRIYHNGTTVVIPNLPTSSAGLPSGGLYVAAGVLMVA